MKCRYCSHPTCRAPQARYCLPCLKTVNRSNYNKAVGAVQPRRSADDEEDPEAIEQTIASAYAAIRHPLD